MRHCVPLIFALACLGAEEAVPAVETAPAAEVAAVTEEATMILEASYAIGRDIGGRISGVVTEYDLDQDRFMAGLQSAILGTESEMDAAKLEQVLTAFQAVQQQKAMERQQAEAAAAPKRLEKNTAWLAENGARPGVITLPSGLQYEVLAKGDAAGVSPKMGDSVTCHYTGTKLDGTVFDSSVQRGQPATFAVGQLIAGWNEALQLMKPGDKWKLFVPSDLAYGENAPPTIGANQVLVFELELISVGK